jgi:transposase-like protein
MIAIAVVIYEYCQAGDVICDVALKLGCQAPHLLLFIVSKQASAPKSTTFLSRCIFKINT